MKEINVFGGTRLIAIGGSDRVKMLEPTLDLRTCNKTSLVPLEAMRPGEEEVPMTSSKLSWLKDRDSGARDVKWPWRNRPHLFPDLLASMSSSVKEDTSSRADLSTEMDTSDVKSPKLKFSNWN